MLDLAFAILLTTAGQILLSQHDLRGLLPYALALCLLGLALKRERQSQPWSCPAPTAEHLVATDLARPYLPRFWRLLLLPLALTHATFAYLSAAYNTYCWYGVGAWLLAIGLTLAIFWERDATLPFWRRLGLGREGWRLSWAAVALIVITLVGAYFRFWYLDRLPREMTSDHIEKLLDVHDLTTGLRPIFFERNTGREPWQFYWTVMFIRFFDLPTKFYALKLGTAVVGLLTLAGVYLLGRELFGRQVGLWATLFSAVASWPVILSRVGLRFPFAPAATAWSLLYLLRGLRDGRRNDFLLLGLWLGIGLHGYTAFRAMPLAVVVCWFFGSISGRMEWWDRSSFVPPLWRGPSSLVYNALLTVLIAGIVSIPLGRYALEHPDNFWGRSVSRMVDPEQPVRDGPALTFIKNLGNLALMFHWQGDTVWVNTLSEAPVLDPILGGLLALGLVIVLWRGVRWRDPIAPLLVVAGVILLLPSALSLAYPFENPSVVRAGGAIPAVMVVAALPVGLGIARGLNTQRGWRRMTLGLGALLLAVAVVAVNYRRYFVDYRRQYERIALNTSEIAAAIRGFELSGGDLSNAWIIAWPYWVDTRGVGIELGDPPWNNVILDIAALAYHVDAPRPRFYVLYHDDHRALAYLEDLFPQGWSKLHISQRTHHDFIMYYVSPPSPAGSTPAGGVANPNPYVPHRH